MSGPTAVTPMRHPGPAGRDRTITVATRTKPVLVDLSAGTALIEALSAKVQALGVTSAQVELVGGTFGHLAYCVPAECRDGSRAIDYSSTRVVHGPATVIGGSATIGTRDGAPFMHCHAAWFDAAGRTQAGHLWPDTRVGDVGMRAVLYPLPGVASCSRDDPETLLPVFTPTRYGGPEPAGTRAVLARVLPGETVHDAVELICASHGIRRGLVRASLGSLLGPVFPLTTTSTPIPGPCTELVSLLGQFGPDADPAAAVNAVVVDSRGRVHGGVIDPHRSLIAVTAEILVLDDDGAEDSSDV